MSGERNARWMRRQDSDLLREAGFEEKGQEKIKSQKHQGKAGWKGKGCQTVKGKPDQQKSEKDVKRKRCQGEKRVRRTRCQHKEVPSKRVAKRKECQEKGLQRGRGAEGHKCKENWKPGGLAAFLPIGFPSSAQAFPHLFQAPPGLSHATKKSAWYGLSWWCMAHWCFLALVVYRMMISND